MTKIIRCLLLVVLCVPGALSARDFTGPEEPFEPGFWYNPDDSGWGLDLHLAGDRMVAGWATYDSAGNPVWYLGIGEQQGSWWNLELKRHRWDTATDLHAGGRNVGTLRLRFSSLGEGEVVWDVEGRTGGSAIEPLLVNTTLTAEDYSGLWSAPDQPGAGLSVHSQGPLQLVIAYFYDRAGEPRWAFGTNSGNPSDSAVSVKAYRRACPGCEPMAESDASVGEVRFVFSREVAGRYSIDIDAEEVIDARWQRSESELRLLTDRPSGRAHDTALAPFKSRSAIVEYLLQGVGVREQGPSNRGNDFSSPPGAPNNGRSQTNLQVQGVDEADVIKSSGDILYSLWPQSDEERRHVVRTGQIVNGQYDELARVRFGDASHGPLNGLYLTGRSGGDGDERLVTVAGGDFNNFGELDFSIGPWFYTDAKVQVHSFNVEDPGDPTALHEWEFDGSLVTSRRVGNRLLLVLRFATSFDAAIAVRDAGESSVDSLVDLGPSVRIDGGERVSLLDPDRTFLPPLPPGDRQSQLTTVVAIDLANPSRHPEAISIMGASEAVHVSLENLWVATTRYDYVTDFNTGQAVYNGVTDVDLHRVDLQNALFYAGSGRVSGHLGYGLTDELRGFRLSEFQDTLRVMTTRWSPEQQFGEHQLTVLDVGEGDPDRPLRELSRLPNSRYPDLIGKPNENLHGVRYVGDRAYVVTFKKTDPLYVLDLADPRDPKIAGELEITGFSDYLHPLPNNLLLGFGKDAVPADDLGDAGFAWFQGLQLSLFDIADPSSPELIERVSIGRRGSQSSLLAHHGAFALQSLADERSHRVAIPVAIADGDLVEDEPTYTYPWQRTGTAMFTVDTIARTLIPRGVLSAFEYVDGQDVRYAWGDSRARAARTLLIGNDVYFYLHGEFWTGNWGQDGLGDGPQ